MRPFAFGLLLLALPAAAQYGSTPLATSPLKSSAEKPAYGVLILAHGGDPNWNREVAALRDKVNKDIPAEAAFGMAYGSAQVGEIQEAAARLESRSVKKIVTVPLFVSSESEVMDQIRYVLGITDTPSKTLHERMQETGHDHRYHNMGKEPKSHFQHTYGEPSGGSAKQVTVKVPLVLTPALDDHPLVAGILIDRAKALSREPAKETVILVGHGPVEEEKNAVWIQTMDRMGEKVRAAGGYRAVKAVTLRDDARAEVREKAAKELRSLVQQGSRDGGRVLVIPHLIARGGIESHITRTLEGLQYKWDGKTLMPDKAFPKWIEERAGAGAKQGDMRKGAK